MILHPGSPWQVVNYPRQDELPGNQLGLAPLSPYVGHILCHTTKVKAPTSQSSLQTRSIENIFQEIRF